MEMVTVLHTRQLQAQEGSWHASHPRIYLLLEPAGLCLARSLLMNMLFVHHNHMGVIGWVMGGGGCDT